MSCCGRTTSSRTTCFLKILLPASPSIGRQKRRFRGLTLPITDAIQSRRKTLDWFHVLRGGVGLVYMEISWCLIRTPAWSPHRVTESDIIYPDSMPLHTHRIIQCVSKTKPNFIEKQNCKKKINRIRARVMNEFWRTIQLHVAYARRLAMPSQASEYIHVLLLFSPSHMLVQLWDRLRYVELNESAKDDIIWK